MIFVYIENEKLLSKVIEYLESSNLLFTTDFKVEYDIVLVAEINKRTIKLVKNSKLLKKKVVFLSYLIEPKLLKYDKGNNKASIYFHSNLYSFLNMTDLVITGLPYYKSVINKKIKHNVIVIEQPVTYNYNIYKKYKLSKRRKKILYIDHNYDYIDDLINIAVANLKMEFILVGYIPDYHLSKTKRDLIKNLPSNVKSVKYHDNLIIRDLIDLSNTVIYMDKDIDIGFVYNVLYLKKNLVVNENDIYDNYLIDNKNIYLVGDNRVKKICKLLSGKIANLTLNGYDLVKDNTFDSKIIKINNISL